MRLAIVLVLLLVVVVAGAALFLASSAGKAFVLRTVSASLLDRFGVEARAAGLEYRTTSLGITLNDVKIRQSTAAQPFLTAARVEVDFSPSILRGTLVIRRLDVTNPELVLDSTTKGATPIPADRERGSRTIRRDRSLTRDSRCASARFALISASANGTHVAVRGLSLSLTGAGPGVVRGAAAIDGGLSVRRGTTQIDFDRARADVSLTGTSLALTSITMESPVAAIGGTAHLDVGGGDWRRRTNARVALGALERWSATVPRLEGELEASGTVGGTLDHPVGSFEGRVTRLRWREVTDAGLSAAGHWSGTGVTIDRYGATSRALGTDLNGSARLALGEDGSSSLRAEGSMGNARRLAAAVGASALPASPLTLVADLAWPGSVLAPVARRPHRDRHAECCRSARQDRDRSGHR